MSTSTSEGFVQCKTVTEYPLPAGSQTHEIVTPLEGLLLITQQPDGALVKMRVDPSTGRLISAFKHIIHDPAEDCFDPFTGLHGLHLSRRYTGFVWATQQFASRLVLIDPQGPEPEAIPNIPQYVELPAPAKGPHVVVEDGPDLWTSCKDSHHIVRINPDSPSDCSIYPCGPRPVFVAVHPTSRDVYATLDQSSSLFRVTRSGGTENIPVPPAMGATPVGMVPGPDGNLWFVLLGSGQGGTGRFGRILESGEIEWFQIKAGAAMGAALIHLSFAPDAGTPGAPERIFVLGSSMASMMALNAVFEVGFSGGYARIETQQTIAFPSQNSMSHRVLATKHGLYATLLGACAVAHLQPASSPYGQGIDEMSDAYGLWGCGVPKTRVDY